MTNTDEATNAEIHGIKVNFWWVEYKQVDTNTSIQWCNRLLTQVNMDHR